MPNQGDLITQAANALYHDPNVAIELGVPPCNPKSGTWIGKIVHMYVGQCWKLMHFDFGWFSFYMLFPCEFAVCEEICDMCLSQDGLSVNVTNCSWTSIGSLNCTTPPTGSWELNTCYTVLPCIE